MTDYEELAAMIRSVLELPPTTAITNETNLIDLGLDSMQMMYLYADLEERYGIQFADDVNVEIFESIGAIHDAVVQARGGTGEVPAS